MNPWLQSGGHVRCRGQVRPWQHVGKLLTSSAIGLASSGDTSESGIPDLGADSGVLVLVGSVYLSTYPSICLSIYLSICLSIYS